MFWHYLRFFNLESEPAILPIIGFFVFEEPTEEVIFELIFGFFVFATDVVVAVPEIFFTPDFVYAKPGFTLTCFAIIAP
jgi:hypothetical protein